jgi:ribosomal protein S18 acetylase RimI-like enzyme
VTDSLAIRRAELRDMKACAGLYVEIGRADFHWRPRRAFRADDFLGYAEHEELWVAEPDGAVVGFLSYFAPDHFLHCLFVHREARGRGLGSALIAHVRAHYGAPHSLKVDVPNEEARRFYERLGYVETDSGAMDGVDWIELRSR